jgi:hypothetical protein
MSRHDGLAIAVCEVFGLVELTPIIVLEYGVVDPTALEWRIDRDLWHVADVVFIEAFVFSPRGGDIASLGCRNTNFGSRRLLPLPSSGGMAKLRSSLDQSRKMQEVPAAQALPKALL